MKTGLRLSERLPLIGAVMLGMVSSATAQLPFPDLQTIHPQGAQIGQATGVTISGTELEETTDLVFSHPGITCEQVIIAATEFLPARNNPTSYQIKVAADVPPGIYEVAARTRLGFTAPRAFAVGDLPEKVHAANNSLAAAEELPLNTVVNGHADAAAVDHYKLTLKQDQRVIIRCEAEIIDSRLDGTLSISDSSGHEFLRDRDTSGRDPLLSFTAPKDDTYIVRVYDFTYRGGTQYPYRLSASDAPHIDFIYPPAGTPGTTSKFKIYGRNLPGGSGGEGVRLGPHELESIEVDIAVAEQDQRAIRGGNLHGDLMPGMTYRLEGNGKKSNAVRIGFATAPIVPGVEGQQQMVPVPSEIHGRFDSKGDLDHYRIEGKKGVPIWIGCAADRLREGSDPLVLFEQITKDDKGVEQIKEISANDDDAGTKSGGPNFPLHSRDSALLVTPPADGLYRISVLNQAGRGGPQALYRLMVRPREPEFELVVTPWSDPPDPNIKSVARNAAVIRQGGTTSLRVFAIRANRFNDAIKIAIEGLPPGITCPPVTLAAGKDVATLILKGASDAASWQGFVTVKGTAGEVVRTASAATLSWSIGNRDQEYTRPRLAKQLPLSLCASEKAPIVIQPAQDRYELELNGTLEIPFKLDKSVALKGDFVITPSGLPHSKPPQIKLKQDATEGKLSLKFEKSNEFKIEPGEWTFSLNGSGTIQFQNNLAAVERAKAEEARIGEIEKKLLEEIKVATAAVEPARKAVQEAENNVKTATGEAKASLEAAVAEKKKLLTETEAKAKEADQKAKRATAEKNNAATRLKQANDHAKVKDLKHRTHSQLITVVVKPPPPKEPAK